MSRSITTSNLFALRADSTTALLSSFESTVVAPPSINSSQTEAIWPPKQASCSSVDLGWHTLTRDMYGLWSRRSRENSLKSSPSKDARSRRREIFERFVADSRLERQQKPNGFKVSVHTSYCQQPELVVVQGSQVGISGRHQHLETFNTQLELYRCEERFHLKSSRTFIPIGINLDQCRDHYDIVFHIALSSGVAPFFRHRDRSQTR